MPLLVDEANKLSQEDMEAGVIEEIIDRDEMFALMPFMPVTDKTYTYVREGALPDVEFMDPYDDFEESAATFVEVSTKLKILGGDLLMDKFLTSVQSSMNDQVAVQIAKKAKAINRTFRNTIINGDSVANPKSFDGLKKLTPSYQTLVAGANGAAVNPEMLDELLDAVKLGADALIMRQGTWRALRAIMRTFGGNTGDMIQLPNFGHPVRAYDGTPVLINDYLTGDEVQGSSNETCSIYAVRFNEADGFHGIFGGGPAGVQLEHIGTHSRKDSDQWRVKWYAGTALKATHAVARLKGVTNI